MEKILRVRPAPLYLIQREANAEIPWRCTPTAGVVLNRNVCADSGRWVSHMVYAPEIQYGPVEVPVALQFDSSGRSQSRSVKVKRPNPTKSSLGKGCFIKMQLANEPLPVPSRGSRN